MTMLATLAMLLLAPSSPEIHVCPHHGSDTNSGLQAAAPVRTLVAARDAARRLHPAGPADQPPDTVNIVLHAAGVHHLAEPLVLDARDSHTMFLAASGEGTVLVSGGVRVDEAAVSPRPGHAGQFQANLTALGLADLGTVLPAPGSAGHEYDGVLYSDLGLSGT